MDVWETLQFGVSTYRDRIGYDQDPAIPMPYEITNYAGLILIQPQPPKSREDGSIMRAIVIGSGLSGLITAHALDKAGVTDFVILEGRANPVEQSGSVIALYPQTFRIFDQLGVLRQMMDLGSPPMKRWIHLDPQGKVIHEGPFNDLLTQNHGHPSMIFMRRDLMQVLYSNLPSKETRVLPNKKILSIDQDVSSVTVTCADGSKYTGDILIGCDGVHSTVQRLAFPSDSTSKPNLTRPRSEYRGLFGSSPLPKGLAPACVTETHNKDIVFMILSTTDRAFWLVTDLKSKDAPDSVRKYSDKDIQELVDRYADHSVAVNGSVSFGDLWRTRYDPDGPSRPGLYDYLEGVAKRWYSGRVVIVGDAAHQMTPNLGQGGNNAIEDVASLVNQLHGLLKIVPSPTPAELEAAFARYQDERENRVKKTAGLTGKYTQWTSWRNWSGWFMLSWLWPLLGDRVVVNWLVSPMVKESIKLDFVEERDLPVGKVPWKFA
ncbi:hypothetical protein V8F20_001413 [Naviculisporaceae sp. PSN 640]